MSCNQTNIPMRSIVHESALVFECGFTLYGIPAQGLLVMIVVSRTNYLVAASASIFFV